MTGLATNPVAEQAVLAGLLSEPEVGPLVDILRPEDFSLEKHRRILAAMSELRTEKVAIDRVTVAGKLRDKGQLESVDGLSYLIELDNSLPPGLNLEHYVRALQEQTSRRRLQRIGLDLMNRAEKEPSAEVLAWLQAALSEAQAGSADGSGALTPAQVIERAGGPDGLFGGPNKALGAIPTPWPRLTELITGFRPGELWILAGNPGMGKSAAAVQIAHWAAKAGTVTQVFSLEMTAESLIQRLACQLARVDLHRMRAGFLNAEERVRLRLAANELAELDGMLIADRLQATVAGIRTAIWRTKPRPGLVVIDYLGLMTAIGRHQNMHAAISEITRALKVLAMEEGIALLVLAQLNRENAKSGRPPILSDLRESGSIEENADGVMFVWREEVYKPDREDLRGLAEIIVAKQRNGPVGKVSLVFLHHLTKFESRADNL